MNKEIKSLRVADPLVADRIHYALNQLAPKTIWRNSGCDGYWLIKPKHDAGEGNTWLESKQYASPTFRKVDSEFSISFP